MLTPARIVSALKSQLKQRGITYRSVAARLGLSESAVKNMFATGNMSLKRLDELCAVLELDIGALVNIAEVQEPKIDELSAEHEAELVSDVRLLLMLYCALNYWTFDDIQKKYEISSSDGDKLLRRLDKMGLVDLQTGNRVRLLVSNNFRWRRNGAIERYFRSQVQAEFFDDDFIGDGAIRVVKNGMLSTKSRLQLAERLQAVADQFDDGTPR